MFAQLRKEIQSIKERDPAATSSLEVILTYPGFHALFWHRIAHWLHRRRLRLLARLVANFSRWVTGIEIHPGAVIGTGLFIDHGMGVVIGETAEVGNWVTLYQGVTLGGTGKEQGKRHPTIRDGAIIGAGARVLGPIEVGDNAKVGASAVVLKAVPPNATVVGNPARIVVQDGRRVSEPDPELEALREELNRLREELRGYTCGLTPVERSDAAERALCAD